MGAESQYRFTLIVDAEQGIEQVKRFRQMYEKELGGVVRVGAFGDAGMVLTSDPAVYDKLATIGRGAGGDRLENGPHLIHFLEVRKFDELRWKHTR